MTAPRSAWPIAYSLALDLESAEVVLLEVKVLLMVGVVLVELEVALKLSVHLVVGGLLLLSSLFQEFVCHWR